ncbi:hypothetical protein GRAN_1884 [Granulicella sibirica]|uniref:HIRAN domain-containing protein n=2 Tax=Granulicella sibirica TaxID=2479048 RepID=A0A4V1L6A4_9BACT|nr:hypothetical protein GRAN_1884 [Granulicella sibirica]
MIGDAETAGFLLLVNLMVLLSRLAEDWPTDGTRDVDSKLTKLGLEAPPPDVPKSWVAESTAVSLKTNSFEEWHEKVLDKIAVHWWYSDLAGATGRNPDGTNRQTLIRELKPKDLLYVLTGRLNPGSSGRIPVFTERGEQVGYLVGDQAKRITKSRWGWRQFACCVRKVRIPGPESKDAATVSVLVFERNPSFVNRR